MNYRKMRKFCLVNNRNETYIVQANCPEVAYIKAGRMGDLDWFIEDELSSDQFCYTAIKRTLSEEYDEIKYILFKYFKSRMLDLYSDAYHYLEKIENILNLKNHNDIINYIFEQYNV